MSEYGYGSNDGWDGTFRCAQSPSTYQVHVMLTQYRHLELSVVRHYNFSSIKDISKIYLTVKDAHALADQIRLYLAGPIEHQVILAECAQRGETRLRLEG